MKLVGRNTTENTAECEAEIASFIAKIYSNATNNPATWYNANQSTFQQKIHSESSLKIHGMKKIEDTAKSK